MAADTPQWDGRIPAGEAIVATAEVGLFVMVRQCERVLERCITMPKFLVLLDFPSDVSIELPEEVRRRHPTTSQCFLFFWAAAQRLVLG